MRAHLACRAPAARLWKERPTGPLIVAENSCTRTAEARPQLLALACCRVFGRVPTAAVPGRRRERRLLKVRGRELTTWKLTIWVVIVAVSGPSLIVKRLGQRRGPVGPPTRACQGVSRR